MIIRPDYIEAIKPFIDAPLVKILAGVRRCGKYTILAMMAEEMKKRGISSENIIERRYNEMDMDEGFTAKAPAAVVEGERTKLQNYRDKLENVEKALNQLAEL